MPVHLRSDRYVAIGCDLRDLKTLEQLLKTECNLANSPILFVAEVSLTYMPVSDSDSLIRWASTLDDARFCMLEQYLPQGRDHPFARTMLRHFNKLHTPIYAVHDCPSLDQQIYRFKRSGWAEVTLARNLWDLWSDDAFTPPATRRQLDAVEPFDEWEEYALFAAHYFLMVASTAANGSATRPIDRQKPVESNTEAPHRDGPITFSFKLTSHASLSHSTWPPRRFGAACSVAEDTVAVYGGQGERSRMASLDVLVKEGSAPKIQPCKISSPPSRVCHTVTGLNDASALLVGGRTSPAQALTDCWLIRHGVWSPVHDLSPGRYRHCSTKVVLPSATNGSEAVLVFGGKSSDGIVLDTWMLWTPLHGWTVIPVDGPRPTKRFGAAISTMGLTGNSGFLMGGLAPSGTVIEDLWEWRINAAPHPQLQLIDRTNDISQSPSNAMYGRIGASLVPWGNALLLIGGVSKHGISTLSEDFVLVSNDPDSNKIHMVHSVPSLPDSFWPLLIGANVVSVSRHEIVIAGGGAVCFSMGSFWNKGYFTITEGTSDTQLWKVCSLPNGPETEVAVSTVLPMLNKGKKRDRRQATGPKPTAIPRVRLEGPTDFSLKAAALRPVIIENLDLGPCTELWTLEYLKNKIGADRAIVVHQCDSNRMTFRDKNFEYVKKPFGSFIDGISEGSKEYLRSVSSTQPNKMPTHLAEDFAAIAADFKFPELLTAVKDNIHSSPLRISGPVALWLHYDVLANVLCQVRGSKTLHLYPPSDVTHLSYPPGGSSSNIDVLAHKGSHLRQTHPHIARLKPGDVLFIPPLWSHTAIPDDGVSVAVNVFFKDLDTGYAAGKDVYGNRDLQAYENGRRDVERITKAFKSVPVDMARFYLERLAAELQEMADNVAKAN